MKLKIVIFLLAIALNHNAIGQTRVIAPSDGVPRFGNIETPFQRSQRLAVEQAKAQQARSIASQRAELEARQRQQAEIIRRVRENLQNNTAVANPRPSQTQPAPQTMSDGNFNQVQALTPSSYPIKITEYQTISVNANSYGMTVFNVTPQTVKVHVWNNLEDYKAGRLPSSITFDPHGTCSDVWRMVGREALNKYVFKIVN